MPLLKQIGLYVAPYGHRIAPDLGSLYLIELLHTMRAIGLLIILIHHLGEGCEPALLVISLLDIIGKHLGTALPRLVDILPALAALVLDDGLGEHQIRVGQMQLLACLHRLDGVTVACAYLVNGTLAIPYALLPEVVLHLAGSLTGKTIGHALFHLCLGIFHALDAKGYELAATCGFTAVVILRACAVILASHQTTHL